MLKLKIDRAIYLVDDKNKTYKFYKRNPSWQKLSREENIRNKKRLSGYTRQFRSGKTKKFFW